MRLGRYCLFLCTLNSVVLCWQNQLRTSSLCHDGHVCVCVCVCVCVWQWAGRPRHPPPSLQPVPPPVWWNKVALVPSRLTPSTHPSIMIHIQHGAWSMTRLQRSRVQHCRRRLLTLGMAVRSLSLVLQF